MAAGRIFIRSVHCCIDFVNVNLEKHVTTRKLSERSKPFFDIDISTSRTRFNEKEKEMSEDH